MIPVLGIYLVDGFDSNVQTSVGKFFSELKRFKTDVKRYDLPLKKSINKTCS